MLGWAGLRGAIPIWLATFPVVAGVGDAELIFNTIFFVVVTSTLIQGTTFEPLAQRLGVVSDEAALPPPLIETGIIRELGGESFVWRVRAGRRRRRPHDQGARAAARGARQPDRPRRRGAAAARLDRDRGGRRAPHRRRGSRRSTTSRQLAARWRDGPLGAPAVPALPPRGAPQVFSVRPWNDERDGDPGAPGGDRGRRRSPSSCAPAATARGALVTLADGRYAATGAGPARGRRAAAAGRVVRAAGRRARAVVGRARLVAGARRRAQRPGDPARRRPEPEVAARPPRRSRA